MKVSFFPCTLIAEHIRVGPRPTVIFRNRRGPVGRGFPCLYALCFLEG